jgi:hypothetical protein
MTDITANEWRDLLLKSGLPLHAKGFGCILAGYADWNTGEHVHPGLERLEADHHVSHSTAKRNLTELEQSRWIFKTYDGRHGSSRRNYANEYRLTTPDLRSSVTHDRASEQDLSSSANGPKLIHDPPPIHIPTDIAVKDSNTITAVIGVSSEMTLGLGLSRKSSDFPDELIPPGKEDDPFLDRIFNPPPLTKRKWYKSDRDERYRKPYRIAGKSKPKPGETEVWLDEVEEMELGL